MSNFFGLFQGQASWDDWEGDDEYQGRKADAEAAEFDRIFEKDVQDWRPDHRYRDAEQLAGAMHFAAPPDDSPEDGSGFEHSFERSGQVRSTRHGEREDGSDWSDWSLF